MTTFLRAFLFELTFFWHDFYLLFVALHNNTIKYE